MQKHIIEEILARKTRKNEAVYPYVGLPLNGFYLYLANVCTAALPK